MRAGSDAAQKDNATVRRTAALSWIVFNSAWQLLLTLRLQSARPNPTASVPAATETETRESVHLPHNPADTEAEPIDLQQIVAE